jgi:hypothetical protein
MYLSQLSEFWGPPHRDVTQHLAINGPWHYQLSKIYYTPEVTAAVKALAATTTSQRKYSQLAA